MNFMAYLVVRLYDFYLRIKMKSYYLYPDRFENIEQYYCSLKHSFRRYICYSIKNFENHKNQQQLFVFDNDIKYPTRELRTFLWKVFQQKNNPVAYYYIYIVMYSIILRANIADVRVVRNKNNKIICFYLSFPTKKVRYFISALIDHSDPLGKNGSYVHYINEMIILSFNQHVPVISLGPTAGVIKIKFGGQVKENHNIFYKDIKN